MTGIAADIPEVGKCRKYGQKCGWDVAGRQGSDSKVHKTDGRKLIKKYGFSNHHKIRFFLVNTVFYSFLKTIITY